MAKERLFNLPETKGSYQMRGIVTGTSSERFYQDGKTSTGKDKRSVNFGIEVDEGKTLYVSMQGFPRDEVFFYKRGENGQKGDTARVKWANRHTFNKEGYRIFAPYKGEIELQRDQLIINGDLNVCEAEDYERTPMIHDYETEEICNEYNSVYELMLEYIKPYERNGKTDPGDYDIFIMTREELCDFCDALRDGDYIIILEEND